MRYGLVSALATILISGSVSLAQALVVVGEPSYVDVVYVDMSAGRNLYGPGPHELNGGPHQVTWSGVGAAGV